jgi:cobyrinic acid a,c-diamide synthase
MLASVRAFAALGGPVYAECGGLMYLSDAIVTLDGARHAMAGLVPGEARMSATLQALGYVEVETQAPSILGKAGTRFRGHQFRYSELVPQPSFDRVDRVYAVRSRRGGDAIAEGYSSRAARNVLASYVHAHWASNPAVARSFVASCARFAAGR